MLTISDIEKIDRAAKALLEDPGVQIEDDEIVEKLLASGGKPGAGAQVVRFPGAMSKEYLSLAPERFQLGDRKGGRREVSPDGDSTFWTAAALFYLDRKGFRPIERNNLADFAWVIENLAEVDGIV